MLKYLRCHQMGRQKVRPQAGSFEEMMLQLLKNYDLQEKNLIATRKNRDAINEMGRVLVEKIEQERP